MATPKIVADFETALATALSIGDTSFTLSSATDDDGVSLPAGKYYFTIDNGTSQKEYVVGTVSGTSVTSVSNVTRQGTESSGVDRAHRVGASVIISDFLTYKNYIDETTVAGAADADNITKGVVETATLAEVRARTATGSTGASLVITPDVAEDLPTADEKAAMAGGGDIGTPSTSNKFITEDYYTAQQAVEVYGFGVTTSATSTIAHGLGVVPSRIKIAGASNSGSDTRQGSSTSIGCYDGTDTNCVYEAHVSSDTSSSAEDQFATSGTNSTYVVYLVNAETSGVRRATVTVDATNISLTWSTAGTSAPVANILWEAFA